MPDVRKGHHGDICYVFEGAGYDTSPTDTTFKAFGSNARMETFEAAYQAERIFNAGKTAVGIIRQNFDGGWGVTFDLSEPPWWFAGVFGQPNSTETGTTGLYEHVYDFDNGNDPVALRLYAPTDGFSNYYVVPGAFIVSISIDQSDNESPEVTLTGGYAREPFEANSLSPSVPNFATSTYSNRDAEVQSDGTAVGRSQNASATLETNTEGISEIGSGNVVDFTPGAFEPEVTFDKIRWVGESVDAHQRFIDANSVTTKLLWDNGQTGTDEYAVDVSVTGSFPNQWSETGRNNPDENLIEELQEMAEDVNVTVTKDTASPPGV